ncbi:MAG: LTA synthase family protein, partial [Ruminococcus sp.]|nr:LTA synthase family protein [Ruminococcus sp.]
GNMFGFKNEYAMGHDIFSFGDDEENIVIFPNGNFVTDSVYYDSQKDIYFDLNGYENVAKYASCNQAYKDDPVPMYDEATDGLDKFSVSEYAKESAEERKNDGAVDGSYITDRFDYASDRIDVSNSIIYYDIINKVKEGFDDTYIYEDNSSAAEPFSPPDMISRKRAYAV